MSDPALCQPLLPRLELSDRGRLQKVRITSLVHAHCSTGHRGTRSLEIC